ncbi:MAG: hypothetical protein KDA20_10005 [Phycisphaerales bacterium]|nr:hypothetical protein [Phycisphaerales bacterium]
MRRAFRISLIPVVIVLAYFLTLSMCLGKKPIKYTADRQVEALLFEILLSLGDATWIDCDHPRRALTESEVFDIILRVSAEDYYSIPVTDATIYINPVLLTDLNGQGASMVLIGTAHLRDGDVPYTMAVNFGGEPIDDPRDPSFIPCPIPDHP